MGLTGLISSIRDFSERLLRLEENVRRNNEILESVRDLKERLPKVEENVRRNSEILESVRDLEERLLNVEENVRHNNQLLLYPLENESHIQLSAKLEALKRRIERLERTGESLMTSTGDSSVYAEKAAKAKDSKGQSYSELDYFDFENYFRGDSEIIKERQKEYLSYFAQKKAVLDLGCGRGEFLELLKENGIIARGVDIYDEFVVYCQGRGLDVIEADAITYLSETTSVDGIFAGQLVEHLSLDQIIRLCMLAYERLEKGGYLVLETPNPMSLAIYTHAFYIDPSHQKPVHPYTLRYLVQKAGFAQAEILFTKASRPTEQIPVIRGGGIENAEEFNRDLQIMAEYMYGSQDYAVIAQK